MPRPLDPAQLDHAIELYLAGEPLQKIQSTAGVSVTRLQLERTARGIPPRKTLALPAEEIIAAYKRGASEYALSMQYGVSRGPIRRILATGGVEIRGMSEAGIVRNEQMSMSERQRQTAAANRAARRRRSPQIQKLRHALTHEALGDSESTGEQMLFDMLIDRGLQPIKQRAIGVYNVDLALPPVAVEILGGGWHSMKSVHAERTPYILDEGWHLLMVWDYEGRSALGPGAADYIVTFLNEIRRNPPATSQYRVVCGNGDLLSAAVVRVTTSPSYHRRVAASAEGPLTLAPGTKHPG